MTSVTPTPLAFGMKQQESFNSQTRRGVHKYSSISPEKKALHRHLVIYGWTDGLNDVTLCLKMNL